MSKVHSVIAIAALAFESVALAQQPSASAAPAPQSAGPGKVCQYVVSPELGSKPYQLCLTRAEWDARQLADAKDANRIVCRYEEVPGSRFRSNKVCMPASQWDEQRRLEREQVERIQRNVCVGGAGC